MGNGNKQYSIGFDLGGTKMLAIVYDDKNNPVARERKKTKAKDGANAALETMFQTIDAVCEKAEIKRDDIGAIGIGCPGMVDPEKGIVYAAPNLGWKNITLKETFEKKYSCPVGVLNDVDAGTFAESKCGAAKNARCVVGIFPGTGIGGSCIYNGEIFSGKSSSCFELGHIQVMPKGPLCGCGQRGCLEAVASRLAIASAAAVAAYRGEAPNLLESAGTTITDIKSGALADAIKAGDASIEKIVRQAAQWLGVGATILVNLLAPDVIVLGGGLVEAMPDIFKSEVEAIAKKRCLTAFKSFSVVTSELKDDAVAMGATLWIQQQNGLGEKRKN